MTLESQSWQITRALRTDAGMFGIWQSEYFANVTDLDTWHEKLSTDDLISAHIEAGTFVPINIGADGAFQFTVRGGSDVAALTARENRYLLGSSQPYLLVAHGPAELGPLEAVGSHTGVVFRASVESFDQP
ncbi:hypothetical protein R8Z50_04695 [Longispora sp. K20-0274]|uniref:hypothetical protein n=1 Tax=Longispora sp. K20-0274 TaxID=3088255 RepID=UPI00399B2599